VRVLLYVDRQSRLVLLHGFIKKTEKTPLDDLELARQKSAALCDALTPGPMSEGEDNHHDSESANGQARNVIHQ